MTPRLARRHWNRSRVHNKASDRRSTTSHVKSVGPSASRSSAASSRPPTAPTSTRLGSPGALLTKVKHSDAIALYRRRSRTAPCPRRLLPSPPPPALLNVSGAALCTLLLPAAGSSASSVYCGRQQPNPISGAQPDPDVTATSALEQVSRRPAGLGLVSACRRRPRRLVPGRSRSSSRNPTGTTSRSSATTAERGRTRVGRRCAVSLRLGNWTSHRIMSAVIKVWASVQRGERMASHPRQQRVHDVGPTGSTSAVRRLCSSRAVMRAITTAAVLVPATFWAGGSAAPATAGAVTPQVVRLGGVTPDAVRTGAARVLGAVDRARTMNLTLVLRAPRQQQLQRIASEVSDPRSPMFRHFLTFADWKRRFAPSDAQVVDRRAGGPGRGSSVVRRFADNLGVEVAGSVGTVQRAFDVNVDRYRLGSRSFFSSDRDPSIPTRLAGIVQDVQGLSSLVDVDSARSIPRRQRGATASSRRPPRAADHHEPGGQTDMGGDTPRRATAGQPAVSKPSICCGSPAGPAALDLRDLYSSEAYDIAGLQRLSKCCNPGHLAGGSPRQTSIAIIGTNKPDAKDLLTFAKTYGFAMNVTQHPIDSPACCDGEMTADIETATAIANSFGSSSDTAHIYAYEGGGRKLSDLLDAWEAAHSANEARVASTSFGGPEGRYGGLSNPSITDFSTIINSMTTEGWTIVAASGDHGAYDNCSGASVDFPASNPNVVAVGGTTLSLASVGGAPRFVNETSMGRRWLCCARRERRRRRRRLLGGRAGRLVAVARPIPGLRPQAVGSRSGAQFRHPGRDLLAGQVESDRRHEHRRTCVRRVHGASECVPAEPRQHMRARGRCAVLTVRRPERRAVADGPRRRSRDLPRPVLRHHERLQRRQQGLGLLRRRGIRPRDRLGLVQRPAARLGPDGHTDTWRTGRGGVHWRRAGDSGTTPTGRSRSTLTKTSRSSTGYAGYTAQWSTPVPDITHHATPGSGDSFYDGPKVQGTTGTLHLTAAGTGCHTAHVRYWDNAGFSNDKSFGPICFDNRPPAIHCAAPSSGWHFANVSVKCTAADQPGLSGLLKPTDAAFTLTTRVSPGSVSANALTTSRRVCDVARNCLTAVVGPIKVDRRAPALDRLDRGRGQHSYRIGAGDVGDPERHACVRDADERARRQLAVLRRARLLARAAEERRDPDRRAPGAQYTIHFGSPTTNPVLELGSLGSRLDFPAGTHLTRLSGDSGFSVSGSSVLGHAEQCDRAGRDQRLERHDQALWHVHLDHASRPHRSTPDQRTGSSSSSSSPRPSSPTGGRSRATPRRDPCWATSVTLSGTHVFGTPTSVLDGSWPYFGGPDYTPALPKSDMIQIGVTPGAQYTISFGTPTTDPVLDLGSLGRPTRLPSRDPVSCGSAGTAGSRSRSSVSGALEHGDRAATGPTTRTAPSSCRARSPRSRSRRRRSTPDPRTGSSCRWAPPRRASPRSGATLWSLPALVGPGPCCSSPRSLVVLAEARPSVGSATSGRPQRRHRVLESRRGGRHSLLLLAGRGEVLSFASG